MKQKFIVAALLVCIVFSSVSFAVTKWACVGDSITIGMKLRETDTYCYKLGVLLGSEYELENFGHSGRTMLRYPINGSPYWESSMFPASQAYGPDIVTIMLGTNDAHVNNMPELLPDYEQDGIDMVNIYKNLPSNPRVIILTAPPVKPQSDRYDGLFLTNAALFNVASATGVEIIDIWTVLMNSGLSDRDMWKDPIHINGPAHTVVAETIYNYITGGGSVCDDGSCDPGEDECNCPEDCGTPPTTEINCSDGVDDDCDTYTDCDDGDCIGDPACPSCGDATCDAGEDQCNCPEDCGVPPATETACDDGVDNDCDNDTDCDDIDCDGDPACPDCVPKNGACTDNADCCSDNCRPSGKCA
jgi:sialate O-acetylesterase